MSRPASDPRLVAGAASLERGRLQELLQHGDWLRRLVRGLVGDAHTEDLVQATWLAALERPPRTSGNLRGWLATVARNLARRQRRQEARRRRRERLAAADESLRPTDEVVADLQLRQRLTQALLCLSEPYRSTIYWRYIERRGTEDIARAQGVSASAVRTRVQRGLEQLRALLDVEARRRSPRTVLALVPLGIGRVAAAVTGGMMMASSTMKLGACGVVLAGLIGLLLFGQKDGARFASSSGSTEASDPLVAAPATVVEEVQVEQLERRVATGDSGTTGAATGAPTFAGLVLDVAGLPVAGVPVTIGKVGHLDEPGLVPPVVSDSDGVFALPVSVELPQAPDPSAQSEGGPVRSLLGAHVVRAQEGEWMTLRGWPLESLAAVHAEPPSGTSLDGWARTIVVAPATRLTARIVDQEGSPLPGARLHLETSELPRFPGSLPKHTGFLGIQNVAADENGRVAMAVPASPDLTLGATHPGCRPWTGPCPTGPGPEIVITLHREAPADLTGEVLDADGVLVAGAEVRWMPWSGPSVRTDELGRFSIPWGSRRSQSRLELVALRSGSLPAFRDGLDPDEWDAGGRQPIRLQLGRGAVALTGEVVHADGRPARGFRVAVRGSHMLFGRTPLCSIEQVIAGADGEPPLERCMVEDDGSFRFEGLLPDTAYTPVAFDPSTQLAIAGAETRPGEGPVRIVVPADGVREELRGRVLSLDGTPLDGVHIQVLLQVHQSPEAQVRGSSAAVTDGEGRFTLSRVPRRGLAWLSLRGDPVIPMAHPVEDFAEQEVVELRTDARCRLRFLAGTPRHPGATVIFLDGDGQPVPLWSFTADRMMPRNFTVLDGKLSAEFAISERAVTLVYYADGKEIERRGLDLVPGVLNRIAP